MKTDAALERLRAQPITLRERFLARPVDVNVELRTLISTAASLFTISPRFAAPDEQEVSALRKRCQECNYNLSQFSKREIRILSRDEVTVLSGKFLQSALALVLESVVKLRVEPLLTIYFNQWRTMEEPQLLERLISLLIHRVQNASPLMRRYREESDQLFSSAADSFLAREALSRHEAISVVLSRRSIGVTTKLGTAANAAAIKQWIVDLNRTPDTDGALVALQFLLQRLLSSNSIDARSLHLAVAAAVLSQWSERSEAFKAQLLAFVLHDSRLGDPRYPKYAPNWASMTPTAAQKVRSWLAQRDIVFFFDFVLPDRRDPHHRKDFWLQYVDKVLESQVALCPEDRFRLKSQVKEQMAYTHIKDNKVSAFLMRFSGHPEIVVVEFSQSGNAVYLYDANKFRTEIGTFQRLSFWVRELKNPCHLAKYTHYPPGQWQGKVRSFLASCGIRVG